MRNDHTAWNWYLPDQAADEIERLRAENDGLRIRVLTLFNKLDGQTVRSQ